EVRSDWWSSICPVNYSTGSSELPFQELHAFADFLVCSCTQPGFGRFTPKVTLGARPVIQQGVS
ncbi:hypothetical protein KKI17_01040, partial [Patescibacteria group bacterium]|nr:hypothetical protein [Patescibacteria group bacterium]